MNAGSEIISFIPLGGLANRIRSLKAAISWCNKYSKSLHLIWIRDSDLNCSFSSLFLPISQIKSVREFSLPFIHSSGHFRNKLFSFIVSAIPATRLIYIDEKLSVEIRNNPDGLLLNTNGFSRVVMSSCYDFYGDNLNYSVFQLEPKLQESFDSSFLDFPESIIGIHMRRTDHKLSKLISKDDQFIHLINEFLAENPLQQFYLACDDPKSKLHFKQLYKKNIIVQDIPLERDNPDAVQAALIEMFILSKCKAIYGSMGSTYSELASIIGNTPIFFAGQEPKY